MNGIVSSLSALLLQAATMGILKCHVNLAGLGSYRLYEVRIATRPTQPAPGHASALYMRMVKRGPLDARATFETNLAPGNYEVALFKISQHGPFVQLPRADFTILAGKTTKIALKLTLNKG